MQTLQKPNHKSRVGVVSRPVSFPAVKAISFFVRRCVQLVESLGRLVFKCRPPMDNEPSIIELPTRGKKAQLTKSSTGSSNMLPLGSNNVAGMIMTMMYGFRSYDK